LCIVELVSPQNAPVAALPSTSSTIPRSILDVSRARETFGRQARTELGDGIAETLEWTGSVARGR
jgi:nucleoside-diphosphate-sugar epimerase